MIGVEHVGLAREDRLQLRRDAIEQMRGRDACRT